MRPKKNWLLPLVFLICIDVQAQPDLDQVRSSVRTFQQQGDYDNALLVLNKALQSYPSQTDLIKDMAYTQYLQRDLKHARETIDPLLEKTDADIQAYQIAGNIYKDLGDAKECDKVYKKALRKFPKSGALLSEYGELQLFSMKDPDAAILTWEKGIEADPSYASNYFHAAKYYHAAQQYVWALFYGEVFINLESLSTRTAEVKSLLTDAYKKFFLNPRSSVDKKPNAFEAAYRETLALQVDLAGSGITADNLTMIRTRFLLAWFNGPAQKFPHKLFDHQQWMLREGLFEAYDQWVFGASGNIVAFQNWTATHPDAYAEFTKYHRNRIFRVPEGQYYR